MIPKPVLQRLLRVTHWATLSGLSVPDPRLNSHQVVIGVVINGAAKAYPLEALWETSHILDHVGGETIQLRYDGLGDQVTVTTIDGKRLRYERMWWAGWYEFHPRSDLYTGNEDENVPLRS